MEDLIGMKFGQWTVLESDYSKQYKTRDKNGVQHFEPIQHFGGEEQFKIRQQHDRIKNNYCLANNIKLIRLPYTLTNESIQDIILHTIQILENPVTTTAV